MYLKYFPAARYSPGTCERYARCRDVETSTHLASFKDNASGPNALALLGQDYLIAAQAAKGALHFWTWHKARSYKARFGSHCNIWTPRPGTALLHGIKCVEALIAISCLARL